MTPALFFFANIFRSFVP